MRSRFKNIDIECWEHSGRLGKSRPFLCLKAGEEACTILLEAVDELMSEGVPSKRTLTLKLCQRRKACSTIRLTLSPVSDDLQEMSIRRVQSTADLEFTPTGLAAFREAASAWRNGEEDFSAHCSDAANGKKDSESGEVWFWTPSTEP